MCICGSGGGLCVEGVCGGSVGGSVHTSVVA